MIRCDSFGRSVLFAALAAAGWLPWAVFAIPLVGPRAAYALYLVAVTALYAAAIMPRGGGPRLVSRLGALLLTSAAGLGLAALTGGGAELAIALAALLGVARSGFFYRTAPGRALAREFVLLAGGLCLARFLSPVPAIMPALWGFLLVQSLFFVLPARVRARAAGSEIDPFEAAHKQAVALLDRVAL